MPPPSSGLHGRHKQEEHLFRDQSYSGGYVPSFHQDFCHPGHLAHLVDDLLLSTRITDLLKMESNAIKRMTADKSRSLEAKLIKHHEDLRTSWLEIPAGQENRMDNLHSSRFMPAAVVNAQAHAREVWGVHGYLAVATFDMAAVGLDDYLTPRGWVELQDPGSTGLLAKQFNLSNNCS
jgi:hypothetical protein